MTKEELYQIALSATATVYEVEEAEITGKVRRTQVRNARHMLYYVLNKCIGFNYHDFMDICHRRTYSSNIERAKDNMRKNAYERTYYRNILYLIEKQIKK